MMEDSGGSWKGVIRGRYNQEIYMSKNFKE